MTAVVCNKDMAVSLCVTKRRHIIVIINIKPINDTADTENLRLISLEDENGERGRVKEGGVPSALT